MKILQKKIDAEKFVWNSVQILKKNAAKNIFMTKNYFCDLNQRHYQSSKIFPNGDKKYILKLLLSAMAILLKTLEIVENLPEIELK